MSTIWEPEIARLSARSANIIQRTRNLFEEIGRDTENLPSQSSAQDRPLSLVLAGQYSAGKSSILKALTGIEDIEIGYEITTEVATSYQWHGLTVVDTPGIGTGLRPDHDEISMRAILGADILVYVVTNEGFDPLIAKEFRELIIERDKAHETILVVNKMERCAKGNTPEQRKIIADDMRKATDPYTPDDLHAVFVDAKAYLRGIELMDSNPRRSQRLIKASNLHELVKVLDAVALEHSLTPRLAPPIEQTLGELERAISDISGDSDSLENRTTREGLLRKRSIISDSMTRIETGVRGAYTKAAFEIREAGRTLARNVGSLESNEDVQGAIDQGLLRVQEIKLNCNKAVNQVLGEGSERYLNDLSQFYASFASELREAIGGRDKIDSLSRVIANNVVENDILRGIGKGIERLSVGNDEASGLMVHTDSPIHKIVKDLGHRLGIKFRSWDICKGTRAISYAGKALDVAGFLLPLILGAKDEIDNRARVEKERLARDQILSIFNDEASYVERQCEDALGAYEHDVFDPQLEDIRRKLADLDKDQMHQSVQHRKLVTLRNECADLLKEVRRYTYGCANAHDGT